MKGLEDYINVAHVAKMNIVSHQSESILVFFRTLTKNIQLYKINITEKNIEQ